MSPGAAPAFWWRPAGWPARLLAPAAYLYGRVAGHRLGRGARAGVGVPVLCVGNFTAGGAGKTPTALALAGFAQRAGRRPGFLSRGHGGSAAAALLIDPARHDAGLTGDEPQLLAGEAPTVVSRDRVAGARLLAGHGCDFIVMDDGFQSARLRADLSLLVVDGRRGLGNGRVLPAGPLRAPLAIQLAHADAVLVIGEGEAGDAASRIAAEAGVPVHRGRVSPVDAGALVGPPLFAFAGLADPGKFYRSLAEIGADVRDSRDFPDHHSFTPEEIAELTAVAEGNGYLLATTAKDAARLAASEEGRALLAQGLVLDVALTLDAGIGESLIARTLEAFETRSQP